jgi:8-oxo-dGTP pyrophosphatase MutT (NUDIX family)
MIAVDFDGGRFNVRAAGVCARDGHVLLQRAAAEDFWALPGGRPEFAEDSRAALLREMREELGVEIACGRLLWVLENFFTYAERSFHELAFYYAMTLPAASPLLDLEQEYAGLELDNPLVFRWFPIDDLVNVRLYPRVFRTALRELPATTHHLIHTDIAD